MDNVEISLSPNISNQIFIPGGHRDVVLLVANHTDKYFLPDLAGGNPHRIDKYKCMFSI